MASCEEICPYIAFHQDRADNAGRCFEAAELLLSGALRISEQSEAAVHADVALLGVRQAIRFHSRDNDDIEGLIAANPGKMQPAVNTRRTSLELMAFHSAEIEHAESTCNDVQRKTTLTGRDYVRCTAEIPLVFKIMRTFVDAKPAE